MVYSVEKAVEDQILIKYDNNKAMDFQMEGNCYKCGRVGTFMRFCTMCSDGTEIGRTGQPIKARCCFTYMVNSGYYLNPFMLARLKGREESSLTTDAKKISRPIVQFFTQDWIWEEWIDHDKYGNKATILAKINGCQWDKMTPEEVAFLRRLVARSV